jgi:outer membrane receptor for Fe3+-dicitrate
MKNFLPKQSFIPNWNDWTGLQSRKLKLLFLAFSTFLSMSIFAQQKTVSGRVATGDSAVAGATVTLKGTNTGTQTDANGRFTISAPANGTLVISSIGYATAEVKINNRTNISVPLQSALTEMQQVVVVGYGTQKKATLTGSVSTVRGSEVAKSPAMNVSNSLGGRLPGLVTVTPSGEPGADGSVLRIRGVNTLGNNNPLIVVDGIPGRSLDRIDPSTIESISVLKDA